MPSLPPAIDLYVRHRGRGQLVVGLHDLNHDGRQMLDALSLLPQREYRVLAPDLRGHGKSPSPAGPWSIDDFASDVARIVADEGAPAVVVGQGVGAAAALALALGHPGLVRGLVVTGISPRNEDANAQDRWTKVARILRERDREGIALTAEAMAARPDWRGALPQIDIPTVVLAATGDRSVPVELQRELGMWIRGARVHTVKAGHDVAAEFPETLTDAIGEVLHGDRAVVVA
jgi:pimeloyl-ACP methyl ester carboxylesterase